MDEIARHERDLDVPGEGVGPPPDIATDGTMFAHQPSFKVIAISTLLFALVTVVALPFIYQRTARADDNSGQVAVGNELASCRADSRSAVDDANKDLTILVIRGLRATAEGDRVQLEAIVTESKQAELALIAATDGYRKAVRESIEHPTRFLTECKAVR